MDSIADVVRNVGNAVVNPTRHAVLHAVADVRVKDVHAVLQVRQVVAKSGYRVVDLLADVVGDIVHNRVVDGIADVVEHHGVDGVVEFGIAVRDGCSHALVHVVAVLDFIVAQRIHNGVVDLRADSIFYIVNDGIVNLLADVILNVVHDRVMDLAADVVHDAVVDGIADEVRDVARIAGLQGVGHGRNRGEP